MDLFQTNYSSRWGMPTQTSLLLAIRQQLWAISDRSDRDDLNMTKLAAPQLIHCQRIAGQLTYLSALPHQLLSGAKDSSPPALGKYLLEQLATRFPEQSVAPWQGTINNQGYLYLQPSGKAIALWLNARLPGQAGVNPNRQPLTSSSIALQYVYVRCAQLRRLFSPAALVPLIGLDLTAQTTKEIELIGALLDIWDVMAVDRLAPPPQSRQIRSSSQQLVEKFLEFEQTCCLAAIKSTASLQLSYCLIAIVQITVQQILLNYWGLQPLENW